MPNLERYRRLPWEAVIWAAGLVALACADPEAPGLLDACFFRWIGLPWCPGCGLGHAVAYLFDGEVVRALQTHPLAPFAVAVLAGRIVHLAREAWPSFASQPQTPPS